MPKAKIKSKPRRPNHKTIPDPSSGLLTRRQVAAMLGVQPQTLAAGEVRGRPLLSKISLSKTMMCYRQSDISALIDLPSSAEMLARLKERDGPIVMAGLIRAFVPKRERAFHAYAALILAVHEYDEAVANSPYWRKMAVGGNAIAGELARRLPRYHLRQAVLAARRLMGAGLACVAGPAQTGDLHGEASLCLAELGREMLAEINRRLSQERSAAVGLRRLPEFP